MTEEYNEKSKMEEMPVRESGIRENLRQVEANIQSACRRAGRSRDEVSLIAVSKTNPAARVREAYLLGQREFGENRVKELLEKEAQLPQDIRWHLIGHLQTNKVRAVIDKTVLIHSIDSLKLADTIDFEARKKQILVNGLLEINVAEESSKYGFYIEEISKILNRLHQYKNLKIRGLMTVAPIVSDPEQNRGVFRRLKELSIDINCKYADNMAMSILSMGMTGDYCVAIEEGATLIRIGTGIFGTRQIGERGE
jgi:hypothetical protein